MLSKINELSEKMEKSLKQVLYLKDEEVFIGNEEKLFLLFLLYQLPGSKHYFFQNRLLDTSEKTLNTFYDIFYLELGQRASRKNVISLGMLKALIYKCLLNLVFMLRLIFYKKSLDTMIHSTGYHNPHPLLIPQLTNKKRLCKIKNPMLRKNFLNSLLDNEIEEKIAGFIVNLFPLSHLENFHKISNSFILKILRPKRVIANIYGMMQDPLLSALVRKSKSKLIYTQHGGGYGLNRHHDAHIIEIHGSDEFLYWLIGDRGILPTRYKKRYLALNAFNKSSKYVVIILSTKFPKYQLLKLIETCKEINKNSSLTIYVSKHPSIEYDLDEDPFFLINGITNKFHENSILNIYDGPHNSLMFQRILAKKPFLILDTIKTYSINRDFYEVLLGLKSSKIMIPKDRLKEILELSFNLNNFEEYINGLEKALFEKVFNYDNISLFDHLKNEV